MTNVKASWQGQIQGEAIVAIAPPKTYMSNYVNHDILQFGKQHSRYKTILPSTDLSQQCLFIYFTTILLQAVAWLVQFCRVTSSFQSTARVNSKKKKHK